MADNTLIETSLSSFANPQFFTKAVVLDGAPFTRTLETLSRYPRRCFQLFTAQYLKDVIADVVDATCNAECPPEPPEAPTAAVAPVEPSEPTPQLPTASRTFYVTPCAGIEGSQPTDGVHERVFKYGRTPMIDGNGEPYGYYNGAGSGVSVYPNPLKGRLADNLTYTEKHRLFFHMPSILANATREFALYPPTAFLALAMLPVIRTYSIALYEYVLHQCCVALFNMYRDEHKLKTPQGVPPLLTSLARTPLLDEPLKALTRWYTRMTPGSHYLPNPLMVELCRSLQDYFQCTCAPLLGRRPHLPGVHTWDNRCITLRAAKTYAQTARTAWLPYLNPTPENESGKIISTLTHTGFNHLASTAEERRHICDLVSYIPTPADYHRHADATRNHRRGFMPNMGTIYYVYAFLQEIGEFAEASNRASRYSYVRTGLAATARGTSYLSRTAMAVNWEKTKYLIDKLFLRDFRSEFRRLDMEVSWADASNPVMRPLYLRTSRGWSATVPEDVHADLVADTPQTVHRGSEKYAVTPYALVPMSCVWFYLQNCTTNHVNDRLFYSNAASPDKVFLKTVYKARKSASVAALLKLVHPITNDLVLHILVPTAANAPNKVLFHIQNKLMDPPTADSFGDAAVDMTHVLANYPDRFDITPPVYVDARMLLSSACPWRASMEFTLCEDDITQIVTMSNADFLRWAMYGDPDETPYLTEPAVEDAVVPPTLSSPEEAPAEQLKIPADLLVKPKAKRRAAKRLRPEDVVITDLTSKRSGRVLFSKLVQKYLRTYMTPEEYEYLAFLCNAVERPSALSAQASRIRDRLLATGVKDLHAYPMTTLDLRFRKAYYTATGIPLDKGFQPQRPATYESVLSLQKS